MERVLHVLAVVLLSWGTQFVIAFVRARRANPSADRARAITRLRREPDRPGVPQRGPAWAAVIIAVFALLSVNMTFLGWRSHYRSIMGFGLFALATFAAGLLMWQHVTTTFHRDRVERRGWRRVETMHYADITGWKTQNAGAAVPDPAVVVLSTADGRTMRVSTAAFRSAALADRLQELDAAEAAQP